MHKMKSKLIVSIVVTLLGFSLVPPLFAVDYLHPDDFDEKSWSKVIDYLEYVDVYAAAHGKPRPPAGARANLYMTYVNQHGVQMLYAGLSNITMGLGKLSVTLPIQTFMMHFKTENESRNTVTASSYIMLLAYNESESTVYDDSPDKNDTLYASFSMGFDLSALLSTDAPALNSRTEITPLTNPEEDRWSWGMTYTNLTAIWWRVFIDPANCSYTSIPVAVSVYEQLTFTYDLVFDEANNTASITSSYVIGRMTDLWVIDSWWWFLPVIVHYNSTGCYRLDQSLYSEETIYQFLNNHGISMSMVFFQASAVLDRGSQSRVSGHDVSEDEIDVSNETIVTATEDGERISDVDFSDKETYVLHNFTSGTDQTYDAVTRTANRTGFARNPIFKIQTFLMNYIPLALAHMDEPLYQQAKQHLLNMTYADYFYIISYPTYSGYRVEHDPLYTVYFADAQPLEAPNVGGVIVLAVIVCAVVLVVGLVLRRRT
ncbi:MAG: hypothetical protein JSV35_05425 [Candidatus Bathyarchaeota archaeon]|nr:MAG: hypothetical protein JSV35_05425 [Candidatus Bathyarchaeota archaeon]